MSDMPFELFLVLLVTSNLYIYYLGRCDGYIAGLRFAQERIREMKRDLKTFIREKSK